MKSCAVGTSAEAEQIREAERIGAQLQAQRLRQWDEELRARDALLLKYLAWAQQSGVRPLSRRRARKLGIEALYRRRDRLWLVATRTGPGSRGGRVVTIAAVYASGDTIVRGLKAHQLAESIAQHVAATGRPWPETDDLGTPPGRKGRRP